MAKKIKEPLVDVSFVRLQLAENKSPSGNLVVRGEFASYVKPTQNKRFYPESVWKKEIKRLDEAMKDRRVFGEVDHPADGKTSLKRVSHIMTGMKLENGVVVGEAEILPTQEGKNLEALLKSNCKVGVSSRGFGSVKPHEEGYDMVQEDYRLATFDFVADPADSTAYPEAVFEGLEIPLEARLEESEDEDEEKSLDEDSLEEAADSDIVAHRDADLKMAKAWAEKIKAHKADKEEEVDSPELAIDSDTLLAKLAEMRDQLKDELRGELMSDPKVAGALVALENIKDAISPFYTPEDAKEQLEHKDSEIADLKAQLAEKSLELSNITEERDKLAALAKEAAFKYYLERNLAEDKDAELIRNLIGDVAQYENSKALQARVEAIREELEEKNQLALEEKQRAEEEAREFQLAVESARKESDLKIEALEEAVHKLAITNKALAKQLRTEKKLRLTSKSEKIRSIVESNDFEGLEDTLDEIIEESVPANPVDSHDAEAVRARVRRTMGSQTKENFQKIEESRQADDNGVVHGVSMAELRRISGIN